MAQAFYHVQVYSGDILANISIHHPGCSQLGTHWHETLELTASLNSRIRVTKGTQQLTMKEHDVVVFNCMEPHRGVPIEGYENSAISININPTFLASFCPTLPHMYFSLKNKPEVRRQLTRHMEQLFEIYEQDPRDPFYKLEVNSLLYKIIHILFTQCQSELPAPNHPVTVKYQQRYQQIAAYINAHYNEPLTLQELADLVHISKEHLCREFKVYMGKNLREHLTTVRLSMAHKDLLDTDAPLSDIAMKHGFPDLRSYNKSFQSHYGMSPAQYRRQQKYQP